MVWLLVFAVAFLLVVAFIAGIAAAAFWFVHAILNHL